LTKTSRKTTGLAANRVRSHQGSKKGGTNKLLLFYLVCIALMSAAIPFGSRYYLKFDWLGGIILCLAGLVLIFRNRWLPQKVFVYVLLFSAFLIVNGIWSKKDASTFDSYQYFSYLLQFYFAFGTFLIIVSMRLDSRSVIRVLDFWAILAFIAGLLGIAQIISGNLLIDRFLFIPYYQTTDFAISRKYVAGILAATAWFAEASHLGAFLTVPFVYAFYRLITGKATQIKRKYSIFGVIGIGVGILLSYSLTSLVSTVIGLLVLLFCVRRYRIYGVLIALLLVCLTYIFSDFPYIALQIRRIQEAVGYVFNYQLWGTQAYGTMTSFSVRSIGFIEAINDFLNSPIIGIGIGQERDAPYNSGFLTILAQQGLVGLLFYYSVPIIVIRKLFRIRKFESGHRHWLATFLIAGLAADYANGLITYHPMVLHRWFLISISVSWIYSLRHEIDRTPKQMGSWLSGQQRSVNRIYG